MASMATLKFEIDASELNSILFYFLSKRNEQNYNFFRVLFCCGLLLSNDEKLMRFGNG